MGIEDKQYKEVESTLNSLIAANKDKFDDYQSITVLQHRLFNDAQLCFDDKMIRGLVKASEDLLKGKEGKNFVAEFLDKLLQALDVSLKEFQQHLQSGAIENREILLFAMCCTKLLGGRFRLHYEANGQKKKVDFVVNQLQPLVHIYEHKGVCYLLLTDEMGNSSAQEARQRRCVKTTSERTSSHASRLARSQ